MENHDFFIALACTDAPLRGVPVGTVPYCLVKRYMTVKRMEHIFSSVDRILTCDRDGRTDILRRHSPRYVYVSRSKNARD